MPGVVGAGYEFLPQFRGRGGLEATWLGRSLDKGSTEELLKDQQERQRKGRYAKLCRTVAAVE